jgi:hypothetical protein
MISRVFLYDPQKLSRVRKLGLWHFLTGSGRSVESAAQWFEGEPKGTLDLNQETTH